MFRFKKEYSKDLETRIIAVPEKQQIKKGQDWLFYFYYFFKQIIFGKMSLF